MPLSADETAKSIQKLTELSQAAQGPANQINVVNLGLAVSGFGPVPNLVVRFTTIVQRVGNLIANFAGTKPYDENASNLVFDAFREFVKVHQALLEILIGKSGIIPQLVPVVGPPLAAVLRQVESVVDTVAFALIDTCESLAENFGNQKNALDATIFKAIQSWTGSK